MKRLSKSDKYAIELLHSKNKTEQEIANELECSVAQVKKVISGLPKDDTTKEPEPPKDKTKNLMIRQTAGKKNNSVSIMTESAAQLSDEFIKNIPRTQKDTNKYIFRRSE